MSWRRETVRFHHQTSDEAGGRSPLRGTRTSVKIETTFLSSESGVSQVYLPTWRRHLLRLDRSFSFRSRRTPIALRLALTSSHGLLGVGLHHRLLHLRDDKVCGGQELVSGHHQPDRTAAHHRVFCRVSGSCLNVCMSCGWLWFLIICCLLLLKPLIFPKCLHSPLMTSSTEISAATPTQRKWLEFNLWGLTLWKITS